MTYNLNFLIAALAFLVVISFHFMNCRKLESVHVRIFRFFLVLGFTDILLDLITTILIGGEGASLPGVTHFLLTAFYICQVLVPYALLLYACFLSGHYLNPENLMSQLLSAPAIIMAFMVLYNWNSGVLFKFTQEGEYIRGPLYISMFIYALVYAAIILINSLWWYRDLGFRSFGVICGFLIILTVCVAIQAVRNDLLLTGFGLGLGITLLYLTVGNPSEYIDRLTGVFNLPSFMSCVGELYKHKKDFHIVTVDIRQLKQINMLYGMDFGDLFIIRIAEELGRILDTSYVFRVSSKRFVMISDSLYDYEQTRERVRAFMNGWIDIGEEKIRLGGIVCGIIHARKQGDGNTLLAYMEYLTSLVPVSAETILVQSDESTMEGFAYRKEVERFLITAIEKDLFEVYYQPIYSIKDEKIVSMEALSRLSHPVLGPVSAEVFITIAESNGLIAQIGQLQFRKICRFLKEYQEILHKIEHVKFNISPAEFLREGYTQSLLDIIDEHGLPYEFFQFEITETMATEYSEEFYQIVSEFMNRGISFSLDDFGSGYANLDSVLKLPFSSIKLDRSLLSGVMNDEKSMIFYKSIVTVLKSLDYIVISEGVEERQEVELLQSWGVDMIQGYYFSKPLSSENLLEKLSE
jgi:EAL domain-containing protein (putative c-di-GMP-specific phosphodiesterase class I)/GGDEF domain-containing protein